MVTSKESIPLSHDIEEEAEYSNLQLTFKDRSHLKKKNLSHVLISISYPELLFRKEYTEEYMEEYTETKYVHVNFLSIQMLDLITVFVNLLAVRPPQK